MKSTIMKIKKGSNIQLTKNFNSNEIDCKCNYKSCTHTLIDLEHIVELQQAREELGPLKINSGYRCERHNKDVGGSPTSQHLLGTATDIISRTINPKDLADKLEYFTGLGRYKTFTHIDSRELDGKVARWGSND